MANLAKVPNQDRDREISFERTRFEYCFHMFDSEVARKQRLDNKSQFYLTIIGVFLTAIFLNFEFTSRIVDRLSNVSLAAEVRWTVVSLLITLGVAVFVALTSVLKAMSIRVYLPGIPKDAAIRLFKRGSQYVGDNNEVQFLYEMSRLCIVAAEDNARNNDNKAKWLQYSSHAIFLALLLLSVLILLVPFLMNGE